MKKFFETTIKCYGICFAIYFFSQFYGFTDDTEVSETIEYVGFTSAPTRVSYGQSEITMKISKPIFKKFEPILVNFKYRNNRASQDTIYDYFADFTQRVKFKIENENGKTFSEHLSPSSSLAIPIKKYILNENDSISFSMMINNFGEKIDSKNRNSIFSCFGYLPPGTYKVHAEFEDVHESINNIKTNSVEFEVKDLENQDLPVIELAFNRKYEELINRFPKSVFAEHAYVEYLNRKFPIRHSELYNFSFNQIVESYSKFFKNYPHSFYSYNFDNRFIDLFLTKLTLLSDNSELVIDSLKTIFSGSTLEDYLNNPVVKKTILKVCAYYKSEYEMKK